MPPARKTASGMRKTFHCPICQALLCSKGKQKNAESAHAHFREKHCRHDPKTTCLTCLIKNPSTEHRVACLTESNALLRRPTAERPRESNDVRRKTTLEPYRSGFGARLADPPPQPFEPTEEADLVRGFRLAGRRRSLGLRDRSHVARSRQTRFDVVPRRDYDTPLFGEYLETRFARADPSEPAGVAVRTLISYEADRFYHLMVSHRHLDKFNRLLAENPDAAETTEFYCFCKSMNPVRDKSVEKVLHLHAIAHVPDLAEFKRRIWNHLSSRRGVSYKKAEPIRDLFHFYHTILYVSQQKPHHGARAREEPCKHFLANVPLSPADELRLMSAVPEIALHVVGFYRGTRHLQHYDIQHARGDEYRSELRDVVGALDFFHGVVPDDPLWEKGERIVVPERPISAGEFLVRSLGEETRIAWTRSAKSYCETLFRPTVYPEHEETRNFRVSFEGEEMTIEHGRNRLDNIQDFMAVVLRTLRTRNVRLAGLARDVDRIREAVDGWDEGFDSFAAFWENHRFRIHREYTDFGSG